MAKLPYKASQLFWVGDSLEKLSSIPKTPRRRLGFGLRQVQNGSTPDFASPLPSLGAGLFELKADSDGDTYRVVYVIKLKKGVYVLDAFKKKSKSGKAMPREILARLKRRAKEAREYDKR